MRGAAQLIGPAMMMAGVLFAAAAPAQTPPPAQTAPAQTAPAPTAQDRRMCEGEDGASAEQRVAACTAIIKSVKGERLAEILDLRGAAYRSQGDVNAAIADYSQAIKLHPKFAQALLNRGVAYDHKGEYDRAIQDFDQAVKLQPSALAHFNRGNAHLGKGEYDRAAQDFDQAIRLKPDFAAAYDNRCWARAVAGNLKPALADCNQAIRLMPPGNAATFESRGYIHLKMTNFDAAVSDYEAALRRNPSLAGAMYGRGVAKLRNEDSSGDADIAAAKALQADIAEEYGRYGIRETH